MIRRAEERLYSSISSRFSRYGRREAFQVLFGIAWFFYGISIILEPPRQIIGLFQVTNIIPPTYYGPIWMACGVLAMVAGMNKGHRIDRYGFVGVLIPPLLIALIEVAAWIAYVLGWEYGDPRGWSKSIIWMAISVAVQIVAGWPETSVKVPSRRNLFKQLVEKESDDLNSKED